MGYKKLTFLYRDNLQQLIIQNQRVIENPVHLADLAAALSSVKSSELQKVMEEEDVSTKCYIYCNFFLI